MNIPLFSNVWVRFPSGSEGAGTGVGGDEGVRFVYAQFSLTQSEGAQESLSRLQTQAWFAAIQSLPGNLKSKSSSMLRKTSISASRNTSFS